MISVISRICFAMLYCNKIENDMKLMILETNALTCLMRISNGF